MGPTAAPDSPSASVPTATLANPFVRASLRLTLG